MDGAEPRRSGSGVVFVHIDFAHIGGASLIRFFNRPESRRKKELRPWPVLLA
jgi:hypothetical protein